MQFEDIQNPGVPVRIDKLFTNTFTPGGGWAGADQIWAWSTANNKWAQYCYFAYNRGGTVKPEGWYKYDSSKSGINALTPIENDDVITPGSTFLFKHQAGAETITLTLSGQVTAFNCATKSYSINKGCKEFICYPWPVALKIGDLNTKAVFSSVTPGGGWAGADQVWAWSTANNKWAQYCYFAYNRGGTVKPEGWYVYDSSKSGINALTKITGDEQIEPGQGFLYVHQAGADTITITWKPLETAE